MSTLADEQLIRRASHAGRNISILALLACFGALLLLTVAFLGRSAGVLLVFFPPLSVLVLAAGYWVLAVAARRGNPSAAGVVMVVLALQVALALVAGGIGSARSGTSAQPDLAGLVIPVLVIVAMTGSRNVLLELRKRGLWDRVFGSAKPSAQLCVIGSVLVAVGQVGFLAVHSFALRRAGQARQQEQQLATRFLEMLQNEEAAFLTAMGALSEKYGAEDVRGALDRIEALDRKAMELETATSGSGRLGAIVGNYRGAVRQWKNALMLLEANEQDVERAQRMLRLGDRLRAHAAHEFDAQYAGGP